MGQHLHMSGNLPKLGTWDAQKTVRLTTSETKYPKWTIRKPLFIGDKKATVLLLRRAPGNLKFLFEAKQALEASILDSKMAGGV